MYVGEVKNDKDDLHEYITVRGSDSVTGENSLDLKVIRTLYAHQLPFWFLNDSLEQKCKDDDNFIIPLYRVFQANDICQLTPRYVKRARLSNATRILITQLVSSGVKPHFYVVECLHYGHYAARRLAHWVTLSDLSRMGSSPDATLPEMCDFANVADHSPLCTWWSAASINSKVDLTQIPEDITLTHANLSVISNSYHCDTGSITIPRADVNSNPLEAFIREYLKFIYLTRASLAFFTKGPMSRLRRAFVISLANGEPNTYVESSSLLFAHFLRTMVLTTKQMDRKYRKTLLEYIEARSSFYDGGEKERRKVKTVSNLGLRSRSDGMYAFEWEYIDAWILGQMSRTSNAVIDDRSSPDRDERFVQRRIAELRVREILAQIILMLEILSAGKAGVNVVQKSVKSPAKPLNRSESPSCEDSVQSIPIGLIQRFMNEKKSIKTIEGKLKLEIHLLVDKLCIWQSLQESSHELISEEAEEKFDEVQNIFKPFCQEILIPFYKSRIPGLVSSIIHKLGVGSTSRVRETGRLKGARYEDGAKSEVKVSGKRRKESFRMAKKGDETAKFKGETIKAETSKEGGLARRSRALAQMRSREVDVSALPTSACSALSRTTHGKREDKSREVKSLTKEKRDDGGEHTGHGPSSKRRYSEAFDTIYSSDSSRSSPNSPSPLSYKRVIVNQAIKVIRPMEKLNRSTNREKQISRMTGPVVQVTVTPTSKRKVDFVNIKSTPLRLTSKFNKYSEHDEIV